MNTSGLTTPPETADDHSGSRRDRTQATPSLKRALIVMGCGLALIGIGAMPLAGEISTAMADSPNVKGSVIDVRIQDQAEGEEDAPLSCTPVTGYEVGGKSYNASSNDFSTDCNWTVGQEVKVAYDPENPVDARIATEELDPMTLILPGSGTVVAAGGLLMGLAAQRKSKLN